MQWICDKAIARAAEYKIEGVDYNKTMGVVKNIIPAIASTNAIVSAACVTEVLKIMTNCNNVLDNYMQYMGQTGVSTFTYVSERTDNCSVCRIEKMVTLKAKKSDKFADIYERIKTECKLEKEPGVNNYPGGDIVYTPGQLAQFHEHKL